MARPADFDLAAALARPNFTPGQRDAPALVELVVRGDEPAAARAAPALAGLGAAGRTAILARLSPQSSAPAPAPAAAAPREPAPLLDEGVASRDREPAPLLDEGAASRLVGVLGLLARAGDSDARAHLLATTHHAASRVRRAAIVALGKLGATAARAEKPGTGPGIWKPGTGPGISGVELRTGEDRRAHTRRADRGDVMVELRDGDTRRIGDRRDDARGTAADELEDVRAALIARWDAGDAPPDEKRALAEALGKVGGDAAMARLGALDAGEDTELARRRDRAVLMASRSAQREAESTIATDIAPPEALKVRLYCRPGLGELLHAELRALGLARGEAREDSLDVRLDGPWQALFASRLWATAAIRVPLARRGELADAIVETLTAGVVPALLARWTRGPIRWRLGLRHGTRRSLIWRVAKAVTARAPQLVNDPTRTTWDVTVDEDDGVLELAPRRIEDPRFAYRVDEVPAASHPSVAAALVWLAAPRATERVWDPFCGSGVELVECARRGARELLGTDIDEAALAAAHANLAAAQVSAELALADARTHAPGPVNVIVTNPPLGSRVHVDAAALLGAALPGFAHALAPGGRLVWISPAPGKTSPIAEAHGLRLALAHWVDLGGVRGRIERWDKRGG